MPATTEERSGLTYGWDEGDNFKPGMDANILSIGRFGLHLSVIDRDLTAPPASPGAGDTYIPAATATGVWVGHEDDVALWDGAAWVFKTPRVGWLAYIEDEEVMVVYKAAGWSAGVSI